MNDATGAQPTREHRLAAQLRQHFGDDVRDNSHDGKINVSVGTVQATETDDGHAVLIQHELTSTVDAPLLPIMPDGQLNGNDLGLLITMLNIHALQPYASTSALYAMASFFLDTAKPGHLPEFVVVRIYFI